MVNIREISPELQKKAQDELNEVPSRIEEDILALRTWISKQAHLRARTDDQFLITYLRGSKYSLERAKEKIDLNFTVRSLMPEMFESRDPTDPITLEIIKLGFVLPLPLTESPDSPVIMLMRMGHIDPAKYTMQQMMKVSSMVMDLLIRDNDQFVISGQMAIGDMEHTGVRHFMQMSPTLMKKMATLSQDASPLRQKGQHFLNAPSAFEAIFNFFKGLLNEKNKNRMYVHGKNWEELYKHIPKRLLPAEYGGEAGPIQNIIDDWEKNLVASKEYFQEDGKYGTDEKKRVGRPKNSESLFGIDGSFRKLEVF